MSWALILGGAVLLGSACCDIRWRIIPDGCVLAVVAAGIAIKAQADLVTGLIALGVAIAVFLGMLFLFHLGAVGGGDVKLLAAATLLVPPESVPSQLLLISLTGGALALVALLFPSLLGARLAERPAAASDLAPAPADPAAADSFGYAGHGLPYGVAICLGTLANLVIPS